MGIFFTIRVGTNKAECKICREKITQGEFQITAEGYRSAGSIHLKCAIDKSNALLKDAEIKKKMVVNSI